MRQLPNMILSSTWELNLLNHPVQSPDVFKNCHNHMKE